MAHSVGIIYVQDISVYPLRCMATMVNLKAPSDLAKRIECSSILIVTTKWNKMLPAEVGIAENIVSPWPKMIQAGLKVHKIEKGECGREGPSAVAAVEHFTAGRKIHKIEEGERNGEGPSPLVVAEQKNERDSLGKGGDIVILVMGESKAGKSTVRRPTLRTEVRGSCTERAPKFINRLLREAVEKATVDEMRTSAGLKACTKEATPAIVLTTPDKALNEILGGRRLVFVDTPGFQDTGDSKMGDEKVLGQILGWLVQPDHKDMVVGGVIYIHDITQEGWTRSCQENLDLIFKFCGEEAMRQVLLVTTKWDKMSNRIAEGTTRLGQLKDEFWKPMIDLGASVCTFGHTDPPGNVLAGATLPWDMVRSLTSSMSDGRSVVLQIQREIFILGKELGETEAVEELLRIFKGPLPGAKKTRKELKKNPADPAALLRVQDRIGAPNQDIENLVSSTKRGFFKRVQGKWQ